MQNQIAPASFREDTVDEQGLKSDLKVSQIAVSSGSSTTEASGINNLWKEAYNRLRTENPRITRAFEKDLLASQDQALLQGSSLHSMSSPMAQWVTNPTNVLANLKKIHLVALRLLPMIKGHR